MLFVNAMKKNLQKKVDISKGINYNGVAAQEK